VKLITADWPTFEWKGIAADDPNNTRGVWCTLLTADRHSAGAYRGLQRGRPYIQAPARRFSPVANKAGDECQFGAALGGIKREAKRYSTMESFDENE
jgi:hypothetical protein